MKVLVTGASSMLGRRTTIQLAQQGHKVTTVQRRPCEIDGTSSLQVDIADVAAVRKAMSGQEAVIHLAARVGVVGNEEAFARTNVDGTRTLLDAAREAGVDRFVHVSTPSVAHAGSSLVGAPAGQANPETTVGHYATSKAIAEVLALSRSTPGFAVVAIRPHLVWGPGDTQLVGRIIDRARSGRLALVGSGSALIDATYVDNAADALVAALNRAPSVSGEAFVVSNGQPRTVYELVFRILDAAGLKMPRLRVPAGVAKQGGGLIEQVWERRDIEHDPPMTRFLAEQLSTAHWFDQRVTQHRLEWEPAVSLEEGFVRLAQSFQR